MCICIERMFYKIQIDKKNIRKQSAQPWADKEKYMHDNYVKVFQISLYNEKKNHFYYDSIEYMCRFCFDMIRYVFLYKS